MLSSGETAIIKAVSYEDLDASETTYNFEVADSHTYYVGDNGVLVHNACDGREFKMANRGQSSTGRRTPNNLNEQLAMKQSISNPLAGETLPIKMTDARWLGSEGWVKMQQTFTYANGSNSTIHYVLNDALSLIDDFKFVFPL